VTAIGLGAILWKRLQSLFRGGDHGSAELAPPTKHRS